MNVRILIGSLMILGLFWNHVKGDDIMYFLEDFDNYSLGELPEPPWTRVVENGEAEALIVSGGYEGEQSCYFTDPGDFHEFHVIRSLPFSSTTVTVEYYTKVGTTTDEGVLVGVKGDSGHDSCLRFGANGYIGVFGPLSWKTTSLLSYDADQWYYFRKTLDCGMDTETFYVEELTGTLGDPGNRSETYIQVGMDYTNTYINTVEIGTSGGYGADCYIDQLCITPEPATVTLLAIGAAVLLRRRSLRV